MQAVKDKTPVEHAQAQADFGTWLERQIDRKEMQRAEVADAAGLSRSTITMLINGKPGGVKIQPSQETVDKLADALGIPRSIARIAAGYTDNSKDIDLDFCADLVSIIRTLSQEKQAPLKDMLRSTAHSWAMFTNA